MLDGSKRTIATLTAAACLGAGGWAVAANTSGSSTSTAATGSQAATTQTQQQAPAQGQYGAPQGQPPAGGPGQSFPGEKILTGDAATKATAAATAKLPGATIDRVETDANDGGVYEAHVTKADGSRATVLMDASFTVTKVLDH